MSIVYSDTQDDWSNQYKSKEDAATMVLEIMDDEEFQKCKTVEIYQGEMSRQVITDFFDITRIIETISDAAYENCDDYLEEYLTDIGNEDIVLLKTLVESQLIKWANETGNQPNTYKVKDVRPVCFNVSELKKELL